MGHCIPTFLAIDEPVYKDGPSFDKFKVSSLLEERVRYSQ